jgi:hypothetical protein
MPSKRARKAAAPPPEETVADLPAERTSPEGEEELKGGSASKYIGETEKNLGQLFGRAEPTDATLYFDEGDQLFKR